MLILLKTLENPIPQGDFSSKPLDYRILSYLRKQVSILIVGSYGFPLARE